MLFSHFLFDVCKEQVDRLVLPLNPVRPSRPYVEKLERNRKKPIIMESNDNNKVSAAELFSKTLFNISCFQTARVQV